MGLTLYKKDTSPPTRSVIMVLNALNISDVKLINVNLPEKEHLTEEYLKINPQHTVPTLIDGDFIIWDSHAIGAYLVGKYAENDSLYPVDIQKRAIIDQRLHFDSGILFPALRGAVEPILYAGEKEYRPENLAKITAAYNLAEKFLDSTWLAGDKPTLADICCVSTISSMNEIVSIDVKLYPKLTAWLKQCSQEDFYIKGNEPGLQKFRDMIKSKFA